MYKVGTICIGQNFRNRGHDRNGMECEIVSPLSMKRARSVYSGKISRGRSKRYGVRWADGRLSAIYPEYLRPKHLPPDTGLTAVLNLFKEPVNA